MHLYASSAMSKDGVAAYVTRMIPGTCHLKCTVANTHYMYNICRHIPLMSTGLMDTQATGWIHLSNSYCTVLIYVMMTGLGTKITIQLFLLRRKGDSATLSAVGGRCA